MKRLFSTTPILALSLMLSSAHSNDFVHIHLKREIDLFWRTRLNLTFAVDIGSREGRKFLLERAKESFETFVTGLGKLPETTTKLPHCDLARCHLDRDCYDYDNNLFHPTACKSALLSEHQVNRCLGRNQVMLVGDSRTREVFDGLFSMGGHGWRYNVITQKIGRNLLKVQFVNKTDNSKDASHVDYFWSENNSPLDVTFDAVREAGSKKNNVILLIGGVGAHVWQNIERGKSVRDQLRLFTERLQQILGNVRELMDAGLLKEVIYMMDTIPLRMPAASGYFKWLVVRYNEMVRGVLRKHPYVKIWDSHLAVAEEQTHMCEKLLVPYSPMFILEKEFGRYGDQLFGCPNDWHHGKAFKVFEVHLYFH